nr:uncharacterized protein LOC106838971 isoform X13 [Equus asinus]
MRPASQEGQTQTCPHGGLPLSSVFHGGVRQNMFSPKGRMFQREREEKGDELLCSQIHKSDCISLPCEQPLEKSDLMPCGQSNFCLLLGKYLPLPEMPHGGELEEKEQKLKPEEWRLSSNKPNGI